MHKKQVVSGVAFDVITVNAIITNDSDTPIDMFGYSFSTGKCGVFGNGAQNFGESLQGTTIPAMGEWVAVTTTYYYGFWQTGNYIPCGMAPGSYEVRMFAEGVGAVAQGDTLAMIP